jgi:RNA polymerase sigma-70 factor (ECF subfamily)
VTETRRYLPGATQPIAANARTAESGVTKTEAALKELMLRGLAGDAAAHAQLLGALARRLRAYFTRRGAEADAEDLVQGTLLAIHLKRDLYDVSQAFTP